MGTARALAVAASMTVLLLPAGAAAQTSPALDVALALEEAFVAAAERAHAGVVTLNVSGAQVLSDDIPETEEELRDFLRRRRPPSRSFEGTGSGFIVDDEGTIYTNAHVVQNATTIEVVFHDGTRGKADVIGKDEQSDVAVLKLLDPGADLQPLVLADSDQVRVGQFALALGAPLALESTFTVGHVSALNRNSVGQSNPEFRTLRYQDFIQVDTPINPGNSGGPLLDIRGRVIGINTAIYAGGDGIGFSIPINMALGIGEQLVSAGKVRRAYLGVRMSELDPDLAELYGLDLANPVIINGIEPGSPAEAGRFMEQDIVLEFGGKVIRSQSDLVNAIANAPIGKPVRAVVYRTEGDEGRTSLEVVLVPQEERDEPEVVPARLPTAGADEDRTLLGSLGIAFSQSPSTRSTPKGATVTQVRVGSPAQEAGLQAGDVIVKIEDVEVEGAAGAIAALGASRRPFIPIRYVRGGDTRVTSIERRR